jgi:hypothetical protein
VHKSMKNVCKHGPLGASYLSDGELCFGIYVLKVKCTPVDRKGFNIQTVLATTNYKSKLEVLS